MAKRFEGSISVDGRKMGKLIGRKGGNLQKVSRAAGHGCYIVAYNADDARKSGKKLGDFVRTMGRSSRADTFYISASSVEAVRLAAELLKNPVRPKEVVSVSAETIGTIIGNRGAGIKRICSVAGDNCYIVHKHEEGGFVVTADTISAVKRAVQKIGDAEREYFRSQREFNRRRYQHVEDTKSEGSNRYEGLDFSSDEEGEIPENQKPRIELGFQRVGTIASRKGENRKRWAIRQRLMEGRIDELESEGRFQEADKLSIHDISWDEVSAFQKKTAESRSARRIQLSVEKKSGPGLDNYQYIDSANKTLARQDTLPQGQWANGVSEDVLSNEGVEKMVKVQAKKPKTKSVTMKSNYIGSWADACDTSDDDSDVEKVDLN